MKKLFAQWFGKKAKEIPYEPRERYNIMSHIALAPVCKYQDTASYKSVAEGIYQDLHDADDTRYRMTISYQLESDDDAYPLEDILDQFLLHVTDFHEDAPQRTIHQRELAGALEDLIACREIIGKTAYNQDFSDQGVVRTRLVIA